MAALAKQIRKQLARYLSGELAPDQFENWFALKVLEVHKSGDEEAEALIHSVEWEFLDLERGITTARLAKENLRQLAASEAAAPEADAILVFGEPIVLGDASYVPTETFGTSSRPQEGFGVVLMGQPQVLRETVSV